MLEPAILYKEELNKKIASIAFDPEYKYYHFSYANLIVDIKDNTWNSIQIVSLRDSKIIGYLSADIKRPENYISCVTAINFSDNKLFFGRELHEFISRLFYDGNYKKIKFSVVCSNPIERTYDKIIEKYNGRVVGIFKDDVLLQDNKFYDVKHYEILKKGI